MLHLSCIFESTISVNQTIPHEIDPPEISSHSKLANSAEFMGNANTVGIFKAANRIYSSNVNAVKHSAV